MNWIYLSVCLLTEDIWYLFLCKIGFLANPVINLSIPFQTTCLHLHKIEGVDLDDYRRKFFATSLNKPFLRSTENGLSYGICDSDLIFMYNENAKFLILQSRSSVVFFYTHLKCHILKEYTLDKDTLSTAAAL